MKIEVSSNDEVMRKSEDRWEKVLKFVKKLLLFLLEGGGR